jgi:hypothetical protein
MQRINTVPVGEAEQAPRIVDGCLSNHRSARAIRSDFKFKPGPSRDFHLRLEEQSLLGLDRFDAPAIESVADSQILGITPSAANPDASDKQVEKTA